MKSKSSYCRDTLLEGLRALYPKEVDYSQMVDELCVIDKETGISTLVREGKVEDDVLLLHVIFDDSQSIVDGKFRELIINASHTMWDELLQTSKSSPRRIFAAQSLLNGGLLHQFLPIDEVERLTLDNFNCRGCTPLLGAAYQGVALLAMAVGELKNQGLQVQSCTVIITDGEYTDSNAPEHSKLPPGRHGRMDVEDVAKFIRGISANREHLVMGVGIGAKARQGLLDMGLKTNYVVDPMKEDYGFENILKRLSRAVKRASDGHELVQDAFKGPEGGHGNAG